ncbi:hypothetical protein C3B51_22790 [Pseudoalteromonas rubra]|uniref:Outer membrane protein beta-barrel domain-containing protein n=1 Tax=Pseudoalteromonas rubra TaxID=43658 RepID=A0A4Q7DZ97_9GAMM|nr:hypothetical protein [Pseudoalteromonas rubra]RZM71227.1 hypothetical protein C3B51_22790 [Pseudoalteromonas rubra]
MKQLSLVAGLATLLAGAPAAAHTINFDKVEVGYKRFEVDDKDLEPFGDLTGLNLALSKRFDNLYIEGRYYNVSDDLHISENDSSGFFPDQTFLNLDTEFEIQQYTVGAGYIHTLDETSIFDVSLHIGRVDLSVDSTLTFGYQDGSVSVMPSSASAEDDSTIFRLRGQYQTRVLENIELKAGLGYEKTTGEDGDSSPLFFVGAGYHFNSMFSVNTEYRNVDDYSTLDVNFRYSF